MKEIRVRHHRGRLVVGQEGCIAKKRVFRRLNGKTPKNDSAFPHFRLEGLRFNIP